MKQQRGFFVTLEGGEGSGKTVQIEQLAAEFERRGVPCLATREPGGTDFGLDVRRVLLSSSGPSRDPVSELLLYLADRWQHATEVIGPALARGRTVLCDRYHDATLVYQGVARGLGIARIDEIAAPLSLPAPDLTLVLDLTAEEGLTRARARNRASRDRQGRFEREGIEFHRAVREGYQRLAAREPQRVLLVDGAGTIEQVRDRLVHILEQRGILPGVEAGSRS